MPTLDENLRRLRLGPYAPSPSPTPLQLAFGLIANVASAVRDAFKPLPDVFSAPDSLLAGALDAARANLRAAELADQAFQDFLRANTTGVPLIDHRKPFLPAIQPQRQDAIDFAETGLARPIPPRPPLTLSRVREILERAFARLGRATPENFRATFIQPEEPRS